MMSVVWRARSQVLLGLVAEGEGHHPRDHLGDVSGQRRLGREQVDHVHGLVRVFVSCSAPITFDSGVLSNSPPSQYGRSPPPASVGARRGGGGKLGGRLRWPATCAGVSCISRLSNLSSLPGGQVGGGEDQARRPRAAWRRSWPASFSKSTCPQRRPQRPGVVEAGPVPRSSDSRRAARTSPGSRTATAARSPRPAAAAGWASSGRPTARVSATRDRGRGSRTARWR